MLPAGSPRGHIAGEERGGLAQALAELLVAAGHGAGAGGHEEPLLVVLAPAAPQAVAVLLALGAAELADEALRHHLVKPLPVLLGDEDPARGTPGKE